MNRGTKAQRQKAQRLKQLITLFFPFVPLCLSLAFAHAKESDNIVSFTLKNGLKAVLVINKSSPMIASVVTVNAGSANEDASVSGVSHMLEHLLFNGTGKRTQERIYKEQDMYGIYNNAHTSYDYTNYMVLVEKGLIEKGLDLQSDMLFNSIFPEGKIEKEKGIVLNELARDTVDEHFSAERFFDAVLYKDTPYILPVLGIESSINKITRNDIKDYYNRYYMPNNMTIMVIGDFEPVYMRLLIEKFFGNFPPGKLPEYKRYTPFIGDKERLFLKNTGGDNIYMMIGFKAPSYDDPDFFEFDMLSRLLDSNIEIDINRYLKEGDKVIDISSIFNPHKGISSSTIKVILHKGANYNYVRKVILEYLKSFLERDMDIKRVLTPLSIEESFLYEKPHYFGMSKGQYIAMGGWGFASGYIGNMEKVQIDGAKRAGFRYLIKGDSVTAVLGSGIESSGFKAEDFLRDKGNITYTEDSIRLTEDWKGGTGSETKAEEVGKDLPLYSGNKNSRDMSEVTLKNGLKVFINSNKDSNIFAVHILIKNRVYMEPAGKEGIADFLHRMLERRTLTRNRAELIDAITSIGGVLKTRDDPSIPYDDYYTSRDFSYIRFETIDKFYKEGLLNLSDIVTNTAFYSEDIEEVKKDMITIINREEGEPSSRAYSKLYAEIFKGDRYGNNIYGTVKSVSSITAEDLSSFAKSYLAPDNLIVTIGTSVDKALIEEEIDKYLGAFKKIGADDQVDTQGRASLQQKKRTITAPSSKEEFNLELKKSQGYIAMGILFDLKEDDAGYYVLSALLSDILSANIRETMGISYALGASFANIDHRYGLFKIGVGTKIDTIEAAEKEIIKGMAVLKESKIPAEELEKTVNSIISTRLMRSLSRISQSYIMGLNILYNRGKDYDAALIKKMRALTPEDIYTLANRVFKEEYAVKVIVK